MKLKLGIVIGLCAVLTIGLLQVDAIGNFSPMLRSIANSLRRVVNWVLHPYPSTPERVILVGEPDFLNVESSSNDTLQAEQTPRNVVSSKQKVERRATRERPSDARSLWTDSELDDFQSEQEQETDQRALQLLHDVVEPRDPVTDLFPETEWYDEIELMNDSLADVLGDELSDTDTPSGEPIDAETVEPLLREIQTQIQQRSALPSREVPSGK